jgi:hypothetical protein
MYLFIYLFIHSFIHLFIHSFVHSFIRSLRFAAMCVQGLWDSIYWCVCIFCLQIPTPLLQEYRRSCCSAVPNVIKYRICTGTKHTVEYSASVSVIAFIFGDVISNVQTAVCLSDWLAEGTQEQFTLFGGGNFSNWQHKFKTLISN